MLRMFSSLAAVKEISSGANREPVRPDSEKQAQKNSESVNPEKLALRPELRID